MKLLKQLISLDFDDIDYEFKDNFTRKLYGSLFISIKDKLLPVIKENYWHLYEMGWTFTSYIFQCLTIDELIKSQYLHVSIEFITSKFDTSRLYAKVRVLKYCHTLDIGFCSLVFGFFLRLAILY